jgi:murein DD-endopeptidase MepM/ murein hydrolase activator NlpD
VLPLAGVARQAWLAPHHDYPAVDVLVASGTPVAAWRAGTVRNVHDDPRRPCGVGVTVVDATWPDVTWTYCHLSRLEVGAGDVLRVGQRVGHTGNTGRSGAPHLHLEVRVGGRQVCPQRALRSIAATGEVVDPHRLPATGCSFVP